MKSCFFFFFQASVEGKASKREAVFVMALNERWASYCSGLDAGWGVMVSAAALSLPLRLRYDVAVPPCRR